MVSADKENQKIFEDVFVREFKKHGVEAVSSTSVFPTEKEIDREMVKSEAAERGMKAVFCDVPFIGGRKSYLPSVPYRAFHGNHGNHHAWL